MRIRFLFIFLFFINIYTYSQQYLSPIWTGTHSHNVYQVAFSPDGSKVVSGSGDIPTMIDNPFPRGGRVKGLTFLDSPFFNN